MCCPCSRPISHTRVPACPIRFSRAHELTVIERGSSGAQRLCVVRLSPGFGGMCVMRCSMPDQTRRIWDVLLVPDNVGADGRLSAISDRTRAPPMGRPALTARSAASANYALLTNRARSSSRAWRCDKGSLGRCYTLGWLPGMHAMQCAAVVDVEDGHAADAVWGCGQNDWM
jgi:hypothetical protein